MMFYQSLPMGKKKHMREKIAIVKKLRKEQLAEFEKLSKPIRDCVLACDLVMRNEMSLEQFMQKNEAANEMLAALTEQLSKK